MISHNAVCKQTLNKTQAPALFLAGRMIVAGAAFLASPLARFRPIPRVASSGCLLRCTRGLGVQTHRSDHLRCTILEHVPDEHFRRGMVQLGPGVQFVSRGLGTGRCGLACSGLSRRVGIVPIQRNRSGHGAHPHGSRGDDRRVLGCDRVRDEGPGGMASTGPTGSRLSPVSVSRRFGCSPHSMQLN